MNLIKYNVKWVPCLCILKITKHLILTDYYSMFETKQNCKNNKLKICAPTWNEKFELIDGSFSVYSRYSKYSRLF